MFTAFGACFYQLGAGVENVAAALFNMMLRSTLIGIIIGIAFMPRSWCKICPMGLVAGLIRGRSKLRTQCN
ncbi:MAG: 4Fe-4S binding protein [Dethiobacter sp.]